MRFVLLTLLLALGPSVWPQSTPAVFPTERHAALREELVYEPEEEPTPPDLPTPDFSLDLSSLRDPLVLGIGAVLLLGLGLLIYRILGDLEVKRKQQEEEVVREVDASEIVEEELVVTGVSQTLLERAEAAGQYDVAVRLLYIDLLKLLQDAGKIRYRKDYSNRDYRRQLAGDALLPAFTEATRAYERFWYGKYPIDRLTYRVVYGEFMALSAPLTPTADVPS